MRYIVFLIIGLIGCDLSSERRALDCRLSLSLVKRTITKIQSDALKNSAVSLADLVLLEDQFDYLESHCMRK